MGWGPGNSIGGWSLRGLARPDADAEYGYSLASQARDSLGGSGRGEERPLPPVKNRLARRTWTGRSRAGCQS